MRHLIILVPILAIAQVPSSPHAPWSSNTHPTDQPKSHVEQIKEGRHSYSVRQGGTMDGKNCRSPLGVGMIDGPALKQVWESNRSVRLENVGETEVINPWLSNGRNSFRNLAEIVASAVATWFIVSSRSMELPAAWADWMTNLAGRVGETWTAIKLRLSRRASGLGV